MLPAAGTLCPLQAPRVWAITLAVADRCIG